MNEWIKTLSVTFFVKPHTTLVYLHEHALGGTVHQMSLACHLCLYFDAERFSSSKNSVITLQIIEIKPLSCAKKCLMFRLKLLKRMQLTCNSQKVNQIKEFKSGTNESIAVDLVHYTNQFWKYVYNFFSIQTPTNVFHFRVPKCGNITNQWGAYAVGPS